jgi:hypothetical protein
VSAPPARGRARRRGDVVAARVGRSPDRTDPGRELAGSVSYSLYVSRDGGRSFRRVVGGRRGPFRHAVRVRGRRVNVVVAVACDGNGNCGMKRLGRFRPK